MHTRLLLLAAAMLLALPLPAATLQDVKGALHEFRGASPVSITLVSSDQRTDGKEKGESHGTSVAEDDGARIHLIHDKKDLAGQRQTKRGADYSVGAAEAAEMLNFAPSLLKTLEGATVKRITQTMRNGKSVTLLEINPPRQKDDDGDKWIKNYVDTLLLWVDNKGLPVAAERTKQMKIRIVVVGFEVFEKDELQFEAVNDHLVVTKRVTASSGSGLGQGESGVKSVVASIAR